MSFKEVRDLAEHLKLLGFPKVFSLAALDSRNGSLDSFQTVAEILQWLAHMLEPGTTLLGSVDTEDDRALLIRSTTEFFMTKSSVKLNPRKIYAACAITAGELKKITSLLIAPALEKDKYVRDEQEDQQYRSLNQVDIGDKMEDLRRIRELSSALTQRGASLYDLMSKETANKDMRQVQANQEMGLASVERTLKNAISAAQVRAQAIRAQLENSRVQLNALNSKLHRKQAEVERTKQRLEAFQKIRPAHMQEFENCEKEMHELFQQYFLRIHVRDSLRAQLKACTQRATPVTSPLLQKPTGSLLTSMFSIQEGLIDNVEDEVDDVSVLGVNEHLGETNNFEQDSEIIGTRNENVLLKRNGLSGSAILRARPTTGRSRGRPGSAQRRSKIKATLDGKQRNKNDGDIDKDDGSSFGSSESSDSDIDMSDIIGFGKTLKTPGVNGNDFHDDVNTTALAGGIHNVKDRRTSADLDLNSLEGDISLSNIAAALPPRPKTAKKLEPHSDEDF